jgi:hypothetical protein
MLPSLPSRFAAAAVCVRAAFPRTAIVRGALVAAALAVSACNTNNVLSLRPDVDVGTQTAAVPSGSGGMQDLVPDDPYLQAADERAAEAAQAPAMDQPVDMSQPADVVQPIDDSPSAVGGQPADESQPIDIAQMMQPMDPAPALMAPPAAGQVLVAPADAGPSGMGQPVETDEPTGEEEQPAPILAGYPRMNSPMSAPRSVMPADEVSCRRQLKSLGVTYQELPRIDSGGSCRIDFPIKVSALPGSVGLKPAATLNCQMALTFAKWTKNELNPAARRRYWSRVKTIHQLSSYSCRRINGSHSMSEHSKGNALDVGRIELSNGRDIDVEKPGLFAFRTRGFLGTVRADGCEYFSTVLGPGYNYDHRNHFHFDLAKRRNGRHACH